MKVFRDFMRFYIVPLVLMAGLLITAGFTVYYTFTARTRAGDIIGSNWPKEFALAFSQYISCEEGLPVITDMGKTQLDENGLWLQVLNDSGAEVIGYKTPAGTPDSYAPYALLRLYQYGSGAYSVFISSTEACGRSYTYLIGFPLSISKVVMYIDTARYNAGRTLIIAVIALTAVLVMTLTVYSYRTFRSAERARERDERAKEEWLANITHDLKTPLAPIRGYAELLSEGAPPAGQSVQKYAAIILKNAMYTEQLVDDLKLTYQLQSNMLPLRAETRNIVRFVKEVIIDILNAPEYEKRRIDFRAGREEILLSFDAQLLRRALANVVVNALKHNRPDTEITVTIEEGSGVKIVIADKGSGMSAQELTGLFKRYYRGADTETKPEGSGLGMAIAKQIVEAHGGHICAQSEPGIGTTVTIELPQSFKV